MAVGDRRRRSRTRARDPLLPIPPSCSSLVGGRDSTKLSTFPLRGRKAGPPHLRGHSASGRDRANDIAGEDHPATLLGALHPQRSSIETVYVLHSNRFKTPRCRAQIAGARFDRKRERARARAPRVSTAPAPAPARSKKQPSCFVLTHRSAPLARHNRQPPPGPIKRPPPGRAWSS